MKASPAYPSLYQINTRVWLTELSRALGQTQSHLIPAACSSVSGMSSSVADRLLSVWRTGAAAPAWSDHVFEVAMP